MLWNQSISLKLSGDSVEFLYPLDSLRSSFLSHEGHKAEHSEALDIQNMSLPKIVNVPYFDMILWRIILLNFS
jgi:hypothetical protein